MGEDNDLNQPVAAAEDVTPPADSSVARAPVARSRGGVFALLIALVALVLAGFALWRVVALERGRGDTESALREEMNRRIEDLARGVEQRKRDFETMRARLADADTVNKSVREELLALGERSRHLEDAVANLAEQRLTGRDALALNEAEFLLQLAQERLNLFHDAQAALAAYRLADSALAAAEDPVFSGVRQTIAAEMQALEAARPLETNATLAALDRIRANLATLPPRREKTAAASEPVSRLQTLLQQFVRISTDQVVETSRDLDLTRALAAIDLRAAQAALLARDPDAYSAALARVRTALETAFDADAQPVKDDLAEIDRLASAPLAPALPELGSALSELRNLRATRALSRPRAVTQAGDGAG